MLRAVVIEDEPLACRYLSALLADTGKVEVIGEAGEGRAALAVCQTTAPDAVFLDIQLPGPDGLSVAARLLTLPRPPLVVFTTAFAGHALQAFEVEAVDYLLKPIADHQVRRAVGRLEHRLATLPAPAEVTADLAGARLPVRAPEQSAVRLLGRSDIIAVVRRNRRTWVYTAREKYPTYHALAALEKWLGGPPFLQVARDAVVNMNAVAEVTHHGDRQYRLRLRDDGGTVVAVSRAGAARLAPYLKPAL